MLSGIVQTYVGRRVQVQPIQKKNEKHRPRNKRIQAFVPLVLLAPVMFAETIRRVNRAQLARCMEVLKKV